MSTPAPTQKYVADLVMEGGGVKGVGLLGALEVLQGQGYQFRRVAGTSAGAIAGALVASGLQLPDIHKLLTEIEFASFEDEGFLDHFGPIGKGLSIIFEKGIYEGNFLTHWLTDQLDTLGVRTFGDLRLTDDWAQGLPENQRYKLVVLATDVTRGKLVRLPWDYHEYGLNPDEQRVVDAVRASSSLPFFYEPVKLGDSYMVDGGLISNFPVWIFEPSRHQHDEHIPTIGLKLSAEPEANAMKKEHDTSNTLSFALAILASMISSQDQIHLNDPCTIRRTVFIDSGDIHSTTFGISESEQDFLYKSGKAAAQKFLGKWDFAQFLHECGH